MQVYGFLNSIAKKDFGNTLKLRPSSMVESTEAQNNQTPLEEVTGIISIRNH